MDTCERLLSGPKLTDPSKAAEWLDKIIGGIWKEAAPSVPIPADQLDRTIDTDPPRKCGE